MARLPVYLRALTGLAERGTATCSSEELATAAGRQQRQAPQGPVLPRLLRHPRRRVRRGVPPLPDRPRDRRDPGLAGRHRRHRQPRARARQLLRLLLPRLPDRRAARRRPRPARRGGRRPRRPRLRRARGARRRARRRDRRHRHARPSPRRTSATGSSRPASPASSTSRRPCCRCPTGVDVRKVDLSIELQILAYHEQRKALADQRPPTRRGGRRMSVLVVGVSHKTAPVARARAARPRRRRRRQARARRSPAASTSPRRPCWPPATASRSTPRSTASTAASRTVSRLLVRARRRGAPRASLPHLYVHYDDGAVSHLFHVAAGLDSMVVGEGQILGQTREALRVGQEPGTVGPALNVLFQQALRVGKRVARRDRHRPRRPVAGQRRARRAAAGGRPVDGQAGARRRRRLDGRPRRRDRRPRLGAAEIVGRQPHRGQRRAGSPSEYDGRVVPLSALADALADGRPADLLHRRHRRRARRCRRSRPPAPAPTGRWPSSTWRCRTTSTRRSPTCPASP